RFIAASAPLWAAGEQGGAPAATQAPEFLQTLLARLGDEAVYSLSEVDEHRPERQQRRVWPALLAIGHSVQDAWATVPAGAERPLGILDTPRPLETLRDAAGNVRALRHAGCEP